MYSPNTIDTHTDVIISPRCAEIRSSAAPAQ